MTMTTNADAKMATKVTAPMETVGTSVMISAEMKAFVERYV